MDCFLTYFKSTKWTIVVSVENLKKVTEFEREFTACEDTLGDIPRKKWLQPFSTSVALNNLLCEREWDSLSQIEEAGSKMQASQEHTKIRESFMASGIVNSFHRELLKITNPLE